MNALTKVVEEVVDALEEREDPLQPCPFDGGTAVVGKAKASRFPYYCQCSKCKVRTPSYVSYELATAHWNRRV